MLFRLGGRTLRQWRFIRDIAAIVAGVVWLAVRPRNWPRTVRAILARQIIFTGVDAIGLTLTIACLAGISVVAQIQMWLGGESAMLGPILVTVIVREAGPLLVNLLVISRSGTAIAAELANMRVHGETDVLEAQGIDPMTYLVMPRVLAITVSVFCLTLFFACVSLLSGYIFGVFLGVTPPEPSLFRTGVFTAIAARDIWNLLAKTVLAGLLVGTICCNEGLMVQGSVTDVPRAATGGVVKSIITVVLVSAIVSVLTYTL